MSAHRLYVKATLFSSSVILLLKVWNAKRERASADTTSEIGAVQKGIGMLQSLEDR